MVDALRIIRYAIHDYIDADGSEYEKYANRRVYERIQAHFELGFITNKQRDEYLEFNRDGTLKI